MKRRRVLIGLAFLTLGIFGLMVWATRPPAEEDLGWVRSFGGSESTGKGWFLVQTDANGKRTETELTHRLFKFKKMPQALAAEAAKRCNTSMAMLVGGSNTEVYSMENGTTLRFNWGKNELTVMRLPAPTRLENWWKAIRGVFGVKDTGGSWQLTNFSRGDSLSW